MTDFFENNEGSKEHLLRGDLSKVMFFCREEARSEAERNKKWFLMPVAPDTKLALRSQNIMHCDSHL